MGHLTTLIHQRRSHGPPYSEHRAGVRGLRPLLKHGFQSTVSVLRFRRQRHGMILAVDDCFRWSATRVSGERRAMLELFGRDER